MSIEMMKNQITHERLAAGRRNPPRKRRKPPSVDELWEEYFRLSNLAHLAFEAVQERRQKETAAALALLLEQPEGNTRSRRDSE